MAWWPRAGRAATDAPPPSPAAAVAEAEEHLASIFHPRPPSASDAVAAEKSMREAKVSLRLLVQAEQDAAETEGGLAPPPSPALNLRPIAKQQPPSTRQLQRPPAPIDWRVLPPSPLTGFRLDERGLVELDRGSALTARELKDIITETRGIEAAARHHQDGQLAAGFQGTLRAATGSALAWLLGLCGCYLLIVVAPRAYASGVPRHSIVFARAMRWVATQSLRCDPAPQPAATGAVSVANTAELRHERMARHYRRLCQATTARVGMSLCGGLALAFVAARVWPRIVPVREAQVDVARDTSAYQHHTEGALKWLLAVYFHHPTYRPHTHATSLLL